MRKLNSLLSIALLLVFITISCSEKDDILIPPKQEENKTINPVSQFVYDGLSAYYLWSDEMINKKPTVKDTNPKEYFESVLNKIDTEHGWSWITNDAKDLLGEFAGEPESLSFGYSLRFVQINNDIYAFVEYVFANTPASEAGIQRLDLIGAINGQPITTEKGLDGKDYISQKDIDLLYGNNAVTFTTYNLTDEGIVFNKEKLIAPTRIKTDPVLFDTIYTVGDKKIGYLFYTNFIANYNDRLFEVFSKFKNKNEGEGVTDLILDLRYNLGGGIDAASYLVSLFAPEESVKEKTVLTTLSYNDFLNKIFNESTRSYKLGDYQEKDEYDKNNNIKYKAAPDPLDANLDLNKIYIIATYNSASASELTTFCSRPIMGESNVIHIGGITRGKYTGSWTIHPYDRDIGQPIYNEKDLSTKEISTLKNWAMQPIVAIYKNKNGKDFINPGYLEPDFPLEEGFGYIDYWTPIGDTKDVLLGQALYLITGDESYKPVDPKTQRTRSNQREMIEISTKNDDAKPLLIDNIKLTSEDFKEITKMRNSEK